MAADATPLSTLKPARNEARSREMRDIVAVFVLSITAVLTAWCGFESSKWGGEMSIAFSQASSARVQATSFESQARDARQFDLTIYGQWVQATANEQTELADYIEDRFTPDFAVAFDAWTDGGRAEPSPFARDDYVPAGTDEAAEWTSTAEQRFAAALENNQRGDNYSLLTVLFALVLFLTAMSQRNIAVWVTRTLLGLAIGIGVVGIGIMLTFPIKI